MNSAFRVRPSRIPLAAGAGVLAALLSLSACNPYAGGGRFEIQESRIVKVDAARDAIQATAAQRFTWGRRAPARRTPSAQAASGGTQLVWDLPEGWREKPAQAMRQGNFAVPARPDVECYLSLLPGSAGGVLPNVNRWRKQMGLAPVAQADVDAAPRQSMLGREGVWVELEGTFGGMRGDQARDGWKMAGVILELPATGVFVKMTGPAADVDAETSHLKELVQSLRMGASEHAAHGAGGGEAGGFSPRALEWEAPDGWERGSQRSMRLVTYSVGEVECYITVLQGRAGGVAANVNLWRSQMGQPALGDDEIAALPKIDVLGRKAPMAEIAGSFRGKEGGEVQDALMLGAICEKDGYSVFFKMVGPAEAVRAERGRFEAFCRSVK